MRECENMWLSYLALNITLYASPNGTNSVFKNMKVFMQQYKLNTRNLTNHTAQLCLALVIVTLLYQVMRSSLHPTHSHGHWNSSHMRCIFSVTTFMSCITVAKRPCYGRLKINPSYNFVRYLYYGARQQQCMLFWLSLPTACKWLLPLPLTERQQK